MKKYNVYSVGNALVDIEYHSTTEELEHYAIDKGVMTLIDEDKQNDLMSKLEGAHEAMACGGSAANTIITLSDFGGKANYCCRVADDVSGQIFIDGLRASNVDSNADSYKLKDGITGKCLVFVTPDADRTMNTFLGASVMLDESVVDEESIKSSDYVYIEGYLVTSDSTRSAAIKTRMTAEKNNIKTSLTLSDPAMVQFFKEGILDMLGDGVDLLFANEEELMQLTEANDFDEAIEKVKSFCTCYAITRGAQGAVVFDGETQYSIDPYPVKAIDTLGAGDSFAGAFLYGITHGMDFQQAGKLASMTSSKIVTQYGPRLEKTQINELINKFNAGN